MKTQYNILISLLIFPLIVLSESFGTVITGKVTDAKGNPLSGVNITVEDQKIGASSDLSGMYKIESVSPGNYILTAAYIGYASQSKSIEIVKDNITVDFSLKAVSVELSDVIVETERIDSHIAIDKPVRTEVIIAEDLQQKSSDGGLLTALSGETGIDTKPCALCGSAGIGMQGLDPSYTEINVDGMSILSGVGALYGLDAIAVNSLSKVELTKGSGSIENGTGAMAGSVDLITANPDAGNNYKAKITGSNTLRHTLSLGMNTDKLLSPTSLTVDYASEPNKLDYNNDRLTDSPQFRRINLGITNMIGTKQENVKTRFRYYKENRFAGDVDWTEQDKGSASIYGRDIDTERGEFAISFENNSFTWGRYSAESASVLHSQKSFYGATQFDARQILNRNKLSIVRNWNIRHSTLFQGFYSYENYNDNLNIDTKTDLIEHIPGVSVQHTYKPNVEWTAEGGAKMEYYSNYGFEPTFRGSALFRPSEKWRFRLSAGNGFRPVTIFSLDKAVHAGFDNVSVPDELKPERSWNVTSSVTFIEAGQTGSLQLDFNLFYTGFSNKVTLAYMHDTGHTVYSNAQDAYSRGAEIHARMNFPADLRFTAGGVLSQVRYKNETGWHNEEMQNQYTGRFALSKTWMKKKFTLNFAVSVFGPQFLPENRSRSQSPVYAIADLGFSKSFGSTDISLDVKNLTGWIQGDNPFPETPNGSGNIIDSAMIYGPMLGRIVTLGVSYSGVF